MSGTKEGSRKALATIKQRYGDKFFVNIGQKGGIKGHTGGFASDIIGKDGLTGKQRARIAGRYGGLKSKRS